MEPVTSLDQVSDRVLTLQAMICRKAYTMNCDMHGKFKIELAKAMQRQNENPNNDTEQIANEAITGEGIVNDNFLFSF